MLCGCSASNTNDSSLSHTLSSHYSILLHIGNEVLLLFFCVNEFARFNHASGRSLVRVTEQFDEIFVLFLFIVYVHISWDSTEITRLLLRRPNKTENLELEGWEVPLVQPRSRAAGCSAVMQTKKYINNLLRCKQISTIKRLLKSLNTDTTFYVVLLSFILWKIMNYLRKYTLIFSP